MFWSLRVLLPYSQWLKAFIAEQHLDGALYLLTAIVTFLQYTTDMVYSLIHPNPNLSPECLLEVHREKPNCGPKLCMFL